MENLYLCTKLKTFYNLCQIHDRGQSLVILIGKRVTNTKVLLYEESEIIYDDNVVITVSYYAIGR